MMTELVKITGIHGGYLIARTGPAVDPDMMPSDYTLIKLRPNLTQQQV
jgi:hypothetical protein